MALAPRQPGAIQQPAVQTADPNVLAAYQALVDSLAGPSAPGLDARALAPDQAAAWIPPDVTGPTVEPQEPTRDEIKVAPRPKVKAIFSEDMERGSLTNEDPTKTPPPPKTSSTFTLVKVNQDGTKTPVEADVEYLDRDPNANPPRAAAQATLTPHMHLDLNTQYTATIQGGSGGATDKSGNPLTETEVWSFRTRVEATPPTVTTVTPADGVEGVPVGTNVEATFSEAMDPATLTDQNFTLANIQDPTNPIPATVSYDPATQKATLDPTQALSGNTKYRATVKAAVKDVAGNLLSGNQPNNDHQWSFKTA